MNSFDLVNVVFICSLILVMLGCVAMAFFVKSEWIVISLGICILLVFKLWFTFD